MTILPSSRPWHLAIQPFTNGGHAVTLVVSHALTDGLGLINVLGVAAQVAAEVGRVTADGSAIIGIPVNDRSEGDDVSANALGTVRLRIPADRIRDVAFIRTELKRNDAARDEEEASAAAMLPIVPFLPMRTLRCARWRKLPSAPPSRSPQRRMSVSSRSQSSTRPARPVRSS